jgi:hypothetical protein
MAAATKPKKSTSEDSWPFDKKPSLTTPAARAQPTVRRGDSRDGTNGSTLPGRPIITSSAFDPEENYPEVSLGRDLTAQLAWLTPELAKTLLEKRHEKIQRAMKVTHLQAMEVDIKAGRFQFTGEPIVLDDRDHLINGQHRCELVAHTGIPILVLLIRGVPTGAYFAGNQGTKFSGADALRIKGRSYASAISGATGLLHRWQNGNLYSSGALSAVTRSAIDDEHPGLRRSAQIGSPARKLFVSQSVPTFLHYAFSTKDQELADGFFYKLITMEGMAKGDPVLALRRRLESPKVLNSERMPLAIKAWNLCRKGKSCMILNINEGETLPDID